MSCAVLGNLAGAAPDELACEGRLGYAESRHPTLSTCYQGAETCRAGSCNAGSLDSNAATLSVRTTVKAGPVGNGR